MECCNQSGNSQPPFSPAADGLLGLRNRGAQVSLIPGHPSPTRQDFRVPGAGSRCGLRHRQVPGVPQEPAVVTQPLLGRVQGPRGPTSPLAAERDSGQTHAQCAPQHQAPRSL